MVEHQALHLPIFRHERDAFLDRLGRASQTLSRAVELGARRASIGRSAEDGLQNLGAPAADQASKAVDFAVHQREVDAAQAVVDDAGQSEKLTLARGRGRASWARVLVAASRFASALACFGPTIAATSVFMSVSAVLNVPTLAPSRKTVTRCEMRNTSFSRWVT